MSGPNWQNDKVAKLLRRLYRNEFRRGIAALSAAATNTNLTLGHDLSGKNPDQDSADRSAHGHERERHPAQSHPLRRYGVAQARAGCLAEGQSGTSTAFGMIANYSPEQLAARLMVDQVRVSRERYQSSSSAKSEIVSNLIFGFFAEDGVDTEDPRT